MFSVICVSIDLNFRISIFDIGSAIRFQRRKKQSLKSPKWKIEIKSTNIQPSMDGANSKSSLDPVLLKQKASLACSEKLKSFVCFLLLFSNMYTIFCINKHQLSLNILQTKCIFNRTDMLK